MAYGIDRAMGNIKKDIFLKKQIEIAKKVLGTPPGMDRVMGGMTKSEARELLKKHGIKYKEPTWPKRLKENNEETYKKYLNEEYKSLGYMNDWGEKDPPSYTKCRAKNHKLKRENIGRCEEEISCPICKIYWKIDSSD